MEGSVLLAVALHNWERFSAHALAARDVAVGLAEGAGKRLQILSVYDYDAMTYGGDFPAEVAARHREDQMRRTDLCLEGKLNDYIAPLKQARVEVQGLLRVGNPREVIVETALRSLADVLIIGSHSKRGIMNVALGGTARQVSRHAPCPVVLVSPPADVSGASMEGPILLAVALQNWERYSAHALTARDTAIYLAKGLGKPLQILSVYHHEGLGRTSLSAEMATRHRDDMERRTTILMEQRLDDYIAPLKHAGVEVQGLLRVGNPREVIVETALGVMASVMIVGSHSKRGLIDVALGGTARQVSRRAPCPVVLVSPKH